MTDITESAAWQRGTAAAKALTVAPTSNVAEDREDKWRQIIAEITERKYGKK